MKGEPMRADGTDGDRPTPRTSATTLWERTGGLTGLVQSSLPPTVLVMTNSWWGLYPAIAAAVGAGVIVTVVRAARRQPLRPAFGGFVGVAVSGFLAARSGEARDFFLADIWWYFVASIVLTISILLRRPLVGVLSSAMRGVGMWWRHDRASLRVYDIATAVLACVFAVRFVVLHQFYQRNEVGWLTVSKIAMNYPLWAAALVVIVWAVRRADHRLGHCRTR
jgi:preprotein translocase subunit SecG